MISAAADVLALRPAHRERAYLRYVAGQAVSVLGDQVPPRLLGPEQLTGGAALSTLSNRAALTLGAPLGGLLVAFGGLSYACVVNAATFAVSVLALWSVRPRPAAPIPAGEPAGVVLRGGLRYLAQHRVLRALLTVSLLTNLGFVGPMNVGLALVSADRGWGAGGIGAMLAGFGAGAVGGSLLMLRIRVRGGVGIALAACTVLEAVAVFSVALAPWLPVAVAATAAAGLASGPLGVLITSLARRGPPTPSAAGSAASTRLPTWASHRSRSR